MSIAIDGGPFMFFLGGGGGTPTAPIPPISPSSGKAFSAHADIDPVLESRPWAGAIRDMLGLSEALEIDERL